MELALEDISRYSTDPERRLAAVHNVVVWGRAVTNVLQGLRGLPNDEGKFDTWYAPWRKEMEDDELLRYFYELRTAMLKKGETQTGPKLYVRSFTYPDDLPPAPENARSFFMGDELGGAGWEVELEDGTTSKQYVALPAEVATSWLTFEGLPSVHLGWPMKDDRVEYACGLYVRYLERLVTAADQEFAASS